MSWIKSKLTSPVFWGVVATGLVVLFGLWVAGFEHYDEDWVLRSNWEHFKAAAPNEIGDTLAGFAGALAFVWIIVTVWLQSKELAAQREELRLTREEMEGQREATQDMASSMRLQAQALAQERRDIDTQKASYMLNVLCQELDDIVGVRGRHYGRWAGRQISPGREVSFDVALFEIPAPAEGQPRAASGLFRHLRMVERYVASDQGILQLDRRPLLQLKKIEDVCQKLYEINALESRLSEADSRVLLNWKLNDAIQILKGLKNRDIWQIPNASEGSAQ